MDLTRLHPAEIEVATFIASITHGANKGLCEAFGDTSQVAWETGPAWQRESAVKGVLFHMNNPDASPSDSHVSWLAEKKATGWRHGPVKDPIKKEHPCFVSYDLLPPEQRAKDYVFREICHAFMAMR